MSASRTLPLILLFGVVFVAPAAAEDAYRFDANEENLGKLRLSGCTMELFERSAGIKAFRWKGTPGAEAGSFGILTPPRDITGYRKLRFLIRARPAVKESCHLAFVAGKGLLSTKFPGPSEKWERVEILLPEMRKSRSFDPLKVDRLHFAIMRPDGYTIDVDDIELLKAGAGWRYSAKEESDRKSGHRLLVENFESGNSMARTKPMDCKIESIPTTDPRGHALRMHLVEGVVSRVNLMNVPSDIRRYRKIRFRARAPKGLSVTGHVRLCGKRGLLDERLPPLGEEWRTIEVLLPDMRCFGNFEPTAVKCLRFAFFHANGHHVDVDDVELVKGGNGWRYSAAESRKLGIDSTSPSFRIADFERQNVDAYVIPLKSRFEIKEEKTRGRVRGHHLCWMVEKGADNPNVTLLTVPADIREYRTLRMRIKVNKVPKGRLKVCLQGEGGSIRTYLQLKPRRWQDVAVSLPDMTVDPGFDPKAVQIFRIVYYGKDAFVLDLDDVELGKDAGGWKLSEDDQIASIFGEKRARKVRRMETKHFVVWTDSAAVEKKFHRSLEGAHDFACRELRLEGRGIRTLGSGKRAGKLPVYIFQNPTLYYDFCVRKGRSRGWAESTSGHASGSYFATFYQAPGSATVTHELTHSIVHRTMGTGGGHWFQEGIAVYVELGWQKKSAAEEFAPRLRSGDFVPLPEFMRIQQFSLQDDVTGGPRSSKWLYAQAGAFFEFLLRGPYAETAPDAVKALGVLNTGSSEVVKEVERILGNSLGRIEADWEAWGSAPPKLTGK